MRTSILPILLLSLLTDAQEEEGILLVMEMAVDVK